MVFIYENQKLKGRITGSDIFYIQSKNYNVFYYTNANGNCKHCYIDCITHSILHGTETTIARLTELFKTVHKLTFGINVTSYNVINILKKHFDLISVQEIPTGYGKDNQYHAIFFTDFKDYPSRQNYIQKVVNHKVKQTAIEKGITLTPNIVSKILSYNKKVWLEKYLFKLIS